MAHTFVPHQVSRASALAQELTSPEISQARIDLAACFRAAARQGFHEGICNHMSAVVPGRDDLFLVNAFGLSFAEITASRLLVCDFHGNVVMGDGVPEVTAFHIHGRIHFRQPRARVVFHTHMPNATALAMLDGDPLVWAGQTSLKFYGRTIVDEGFNGLALDAAEGDRIAIALGDHDVMFMKNHGVLVAGNTIAETWDDLYYLERACQVQRMAMSTNRKLKPVPEGIACRTSMQMRSGGRESARQHLESIKRELDRTEPGYSR